MLADAGYALLEFVCTPYRQPTASLEDNELFNYLFSRARCIIEHLNGILKGRFGSLKGIRIQVKKKEDFKKVNEWILVCLILHNILILINDDFDCEESDDEEVDEDEEDLNDDEIARGLNLRRRVQIKLLNWYRNL